ncbi:hypothetical protein KJ673_04415 [Patescibacteria group bacterium]|nr:hypothetical protein [Patescibacteria group bacterium]
MKKILLLLICFIALTPIAVLAEGWGVMELGPSNKALAGVINDSMGYMAGTSGTVFKTLDGGLSWFGATGQSTLGTYIGKNVSANDIIVFNDRHIVITGSYHESTFFSYKEGDSQFVYSNDGGLTWQCSETGGNYQNSDYESVAFDGFVEFHAMAKISESGAVAVGDEGLIMMTQDYGASWFSVNSPTNSDLIDVVEYDGFIVAAGENGVVLTSTDGGYSWVEYYLLEDDVIAIDIVIDHASWLYAATENKIYRSVIGYDWSEVTNFEDRFADDMYKYWEKDTDILDMDFYDLNNGVVSTSFGETYITEDGGETWDILDHYALEQNEPWKAENAIYQLRYEDEDTLYGFGMSDFYTDGFVNYAGFYKYNFDSGALIKTVCEGGETVDDPCKAVYYLDQHGVRHPFLNEDVFYGWFDDFSSVLEVSDDYMASIDLGLSVSYRPGLQLLKFATSPIVYAVDANGALRPIASEEVAQEIESMNGSVYGKDWVNHIAVTSDAFYSHFEFDDEITSASQYSAYDTYKVIDDISDLYLLLM